MIKAFLLIVVFVGSGIAIFYGAKTPAPVATDSNNVGTKPDVAAPIVGSGSVSPSQVTVTPQPPPTPAVTTPTQPTAEHHNNKPPTTGVHKKAIAKQMLNNL